VGSTPIVTAKKNITGSILMKPVIFILKGKNMNKCLNCGKPVKNKYCNVSCQNTHIWLGKKRKKESIEKQKEHNKNLWKEFDVKCSVCGKEFKVKEFNVESPKKEKYYCNRSCANKRVWNNEHKTKLSETCKNSKKVINANRKIGDERKKLTKIIKGECLYCGGEINKSKKYHKECWLKCSGGLKEGSSRGKSGWYKGYWCDSSYELAWIIYQIDNNQKFERNKKGFDYTYLNKTHKFYPDFLLPDNSYVEIKNYKSELTDSKVNQFPHNIKVIYKEEMKEKYLPYVISKYGKNFISLYKKRGIT
jgi:hypothetical protein